MNNKQKSAPLTPKMALLLAAPHSWAASIIPCLLGAVLCVYRGCELDVVMLALLTIVCILMQSAVNTFNDYADYLKGTDTLENSPEAYDAVLVYNNPSAKSVLFLGFGFLIVAAVAAVPAVIKCGWRPIIVGMVGAVVVLCYSFGKKPLSYLPLGELVSGVVMGGLIPYAVAGVLTNSFNAGNFIFALPTILSVGLIMMSNNACDIGRDTEAGRKTFTVKLGEEKTGKVYKVCLLVWLVLPLVLLRDISCVLYIIATIVIMPNFIRQFKLKLCPQNRGMAMGGINSLNIMLGLCYCLSIMFSTVLK